MPVQTISTTENNFTKGFVTEFTGLNFPENAATDADNTEFTLVGDTTRRFGIDYETGFTQTLPTSTGAISTFKWSNAGGDGQTEVIVVQTGNMLNFYESSAATDTNPVSNQILISTVAINAFLPTGSTTDSSVIECHFAAGNGYLFVFNAATDPFYCTFAAGVITAAAISIQIRDLIGIVEPGVPTTLRPATLSIEHLYNLTNQGWIAGGPWQTSSTSAVLMATGSRTWTVQAGLPVTIGQHVTVTTPSFPSVFGNAMSGTLTNYTGTQMTIAVNSVNGTFQNNTYSNWNLFPNVNGYVNTWQAAIGNYPSNADVWWRFKDTTNTFNPAAEFNNVTLGTPAPQGHYVLPAFNQDRSLVSTVSGLTPVVTSTRPRCGTWFQGRVWYAGVDASKNAAGDEQYYTWTENIYFSQIVLTPADFGTCYQTNDPTDENLFGLLPSDGGVITIPGCGSVYNLFPIQNGMIVFAANGVWFITGSQGIGFTANDYTVTHLANIKSISSSSFVDVMGLPYFWNEEGIYQVTPTQGNGLSLDPITIGTILTFYNDIPLDSKLYVKAAYDPINYIIQWTYKSVQETSIADRYKFDKIMNYNVYNKAFFPYTIDTSDACINGITYVSYPSSLNKPDPTFKYISSDNTGKFTFADEHDETYTDWSSVNPTDFLSYFITGFKLHGQGQKRFQIPYIYVFSRGNMVQNSYKIQGLWDYATSGNSGRWSTAQLVNFFKPNFGMVFRRHRIRGQGIVLQLKVSSVTGLPFDIMGWSTSEIINQGV